jgi:phosphatidylserine/phosphatidylglycerophosphate/cardiolipin synthase-like enzyme
MKEALLLLSPTELKTIAANIRTGRLLPPYTSPSLGRFVDGTLVDSVSVNLQIMADTGMSPTATAYALELLASACLKHPSISDLIDLVLSGPQVAGAEHRDTSVVVADLFRKAEETIIVAGYAVYQGKKVFSALAERMFERPAIKVRMFLDIQRKPGDTSSASEIVRRFAHRFQSEEWPIGKPFPDIFYDPRALSIERSKRAALHAKCVVADCRDVFVSSANFTEAAQERNIEVGLLIHSSSVAENLTCFFEALCTSGKFLRAN